MNLVKSKQRVADHGEVFTPPWMVDAMLDLVKDETERIDARFLEPACGSGNFIARILQRKLAAVELRYGKSDFNRRHFALYALMCISSTFSRVNDGDDLWRAASHVLAANILHGDALTMRTRDGQPIAFAEWGYLGKGKFQRRDFRLDVLTGSADFTAQGSLFGKHEIFTPIQTYPPRSVRELAALEAGDTTQEAN